MFWVYLLRCADGRFYTGQTDDLDRRMAQHHAGGFCDFTSRRQPVALVWCESFQTRIKALDAERRIKPWSRAKKEALIASDWAALSYWAKPPAARPSTSLGTNGVDVESAVGTSASTPFPALDPFVPSEVEGRATHDGLPQ